MTFVIFHLVVLLNQVTREISKTKCHLVDHLKGTVGLEVQWEQTAKLNFIFQKMVGLKNVTVFGQKNEKA